MGLPHARVEIRDGFNCRVWLTHDDFGEIEVSNFCQAVQKEPGSPIVVIQLVANNGQEGLERGFHVDINKGINEFTEGSPVAYHGGNPYAVVKGAA